jgi:hypothetical protein
MFISDSTFIVVECHIHSVSIHADGSEASLGVGIIVRIIEELMRILGHIVLVCALHVCVRACVCLCVYVMVCVCVCVYVCVQVHAT